MHTIRQHKLSAVEQRQPFLGFQLKGRPAKQAQRIGGGQAVLTGPSFVDESNIDVILPFAENNTR